MAMNLDHVFDSPSLQCFMWSEKRLVDDGIHIYKSLLHVPRGEPYSSTKQMNLHIAMWSVLDKFYPEMGTAKQKEIHWLMAKSLLKLHKAHGLTLTNSRKMSKREFTMSSYPGIRILKSWLSSHVAALIVMKTIHHSLKETSFSTLYETGKLLAILSYKAPPILQESYLSMVYKEMRENVDSLIQIENSDNASIDNSNN